MRTRDRLCVGLGAAALLASTLLIGGVFRWTQAIVAALVALALGTQVTARRRLDGVSPILVLLGLCIALTFVQLIPLPSSLVAALNPVDAGLRADGANLLGTSWYSCLSMDPASTLRRLAFLLVLLGVALVSLRLASAHRGRFLLLGGVALSAGLVALVCALHAVVNASTIYGIYDVPDSSTVVGPLINPNHLGCLMALGSTLSIGLALYEDQRAGWRATWVLTAVACASIALFSQSRGAVVGLVIGVAVTGSLLISRRLGDVSNGRRRRVSVAALPVLIVLSLGFVLAVYSSASGVADQLGRTTLNEIDAPTSKFAAWKSAPDVLEESPWVGVGAGALEPVYTHAFPGTAYATFGHVENEYIETVIEYGIPGGLLLVVSFGWTVITAVRKWRDSPLAAAAIGGLAGVAFQSSFDFGVRILALGVPATIVACTLQTVPLRETSRAARQRLLRGAMIAVLALAALVLVLPVTTTLEEDHHALESGTNVTSADVIDVVKRHPLDYFAFGIAGQQLVQARDPRAGEVLNHALRLHPFHPGLHRIVARVLIARGAKGQAALEYRTAMNGAPTHLLLKEIIAMLPAAADAASAIPADFRDPETILRSLSELKRDDISLAWLLHRVFDNPTDDIDIVEKLYKVALAQKDYPTALRAARRRLDLSDTTTSKLNLANVYNDMADYASVQSTLSEVATWQGSLEDRGNAWLLLCDSFKAQHRWDDALHCLRQLDASGSLSSRRAEIVRREKEVDVGKADEIRTGHSKDESAIDLPMVPVDSGSSSTETITNPLNHNPLTQQRD